MPYWKNVFKISTGVKKLHKTALKNDRFKTA